MDDDTAAAAADALLILYTTVTFTLLDSLLHTHKSMNLSLARSLSLSFTH